MNYVGYELQRQIITADYKKIYFRSIDPVIMNHFANRNNYTDFILHQINKERIYDFLFHGKKDLIVLDLGGNVGLFTLYAQANACRVITLEPTPSHYKILKTLVKPYSHVIPLELALSNKNEPIQFHISSDNPTMNSLVNKSGDSITVNGITLSTLITVLNVPTIDIVKCDIEGSEMLALSQEELNKTSPFIKKWFLECHATSDKTIEENRSILAERFKNAGYSVKYIEHDTLYAEKTA